MPPLTDVITAPVREFARVSGLGVTTIYRLLNEGEIESTTIGRKRLIILASYHDYIARQRGTPATKPVAAPPRRGGHGGRP